MNKCHCLMKRMVSVCKYSPNLIYELITYNQNASKGDRIITCTIDYLLFFSTYDKESLQLFQDQIYILLSLVQSKCSSSELPHVKELYRL